MKRYKNFTNITNQLYFCASPIRLDSYNTCQFNCVYCFSKDRTKDNSNKGIGNASHKALKNRLIRVEKNIIKSAMDEMLKERIPIQLGGLHDPFTPIEEKTKTTLELLKVLKEHDYPTIISTKGNLYLNEEYMSLLKDMNVFVRLSAAGVSEERRKHVDVGCLDFTQTLKNISVLSKNNIPCSLRIQPIIPGFEENIYLMIERAAKAGVNHISFEHLKIASENLQNEIKHISNGIGYNIWDKLSKQKLSKVGRDYVIPTELKWPLILNAKKMCESFGVHFGAGDTEFIHLSDGEGCCNGSSLFLKNSNQFTSNYTGILKNKGTSKIYFSDLISNWHPKLNVHRYLNKNSRLLKNSETLPSWLSLLSYRWNGYQGPYSPTFFYGVSWDNEYDEQGNKVYVYKYPFID